MSDSRVRLHLWGNVHESTARQNAGYVAGYTDKLGHASYHSMSRSAPALDSG